MSENLELEIKTENDVSTLVVKGYINNLGGERIAEVCYEHIDANTHNFILDLEDCRIVNSIGISILIEVIEKVKELGGKVTFGNANETVAKTFRIMGLLQTAELHASYADAQQSLGG